MRNDENQKKSHGDQPQELNRPYHTYQMKKMAQDTHHAGVPPPGVHKRGERSREKNKKRAHGEDEVHSEVNIRGRMPALQWKGERISG